MLQQIITFPSLKEFSLMQLAHGRVSFQAKKGGLPRSFVLCVHEMVVKIPLQHRIAKKRIFIQLQTVSKLLPCPS